MFRQATKQQSRLRLTLDGPAGSGKTYTALRFAHALIAQFGGRIALVDTERGSASKYAGDAPDGIVWAFDVLELTNFSPERYTEAILEAGRSGYSVLILDSLSHAWEGVGGALELKQRAGEAWSAWRHVTPIHNRMVDAILQAPCHVITTMRSRMEYVQEADERGRVSIRKVGLAPIQRPGMEYEFDLVCDLDWSHILTVSKSRCSAVADLKIERPGPEFMRPVIAWLAAGATKGTGGTEGAKDAALPRATETPGVTLEDLLAQFDAELILAANDGQLPTDDATVARLATLLGWSAAHE